MVSSVVLPEPLGPRKAVTFLASMARSMPFSAQYSLGRPWLKALRMAFSSIIASPPGRPKAGPSNGMEPPAGPPAPGTFADEMLVMAHLSSLQASQFLQSLRRLGVPPIALKAMLTPTNCEWNSLTLHNEISSEHAALEAGKQAVHSAPDTSAES